ncbi:solute carrier family 22 member 13-like isoform X2 [Condylostylus longicornis]|uniref:solute carrier family 22 member 13-like isoform X2 n=1 Tax=Condylostylus longicornis TaxID=2530218 RepID=UPI00244E08C4|nr:solute carrier family 22 member 13-like isoform X2 [Condylostylus longicornis]
MTPKPEENEIPGPNDPDNSFINIGFENDDNKLVVVTKKNSDEFNKNILQNHLHPHPNLTTVDENPKKFIDFDDLLPHIGEFGRYQKILFLCMIPFAFFVAFVYFSQIFITLVPEQHWCHIPELDHLSVEERLALSIPFDVDGSYSKCMQYNVNFTEVLNNGTKIADPSWPITSCKNGWSFNFTEIPYETLATQLEWVCEHNALPTIGQSVFFVGAIVGGLLFGWIADRFGRVPSLVGCNMIGFIAGVATAFVGNFWEFALCRFLVGFAFDNCFTMMYILVLEYVGPKWRTFVANMSIAIFFTIASTGLPWIAYYLADWKLFAIVTSAPLALAIFTPWMVPESARWLVSQGKIDKALIILKKFEKVNKATVKPELYQEFKDSCMKIQAEEANNNNYSVLDLFKTPRLRRITILLIVIWMAISLVFDGHVRNVGSLGLDLFFTFSVACATELPADTFLTLTLDRWGRRWLAFGTMVASGVFSLLACTVPIGPYSAALAIFGRFSVNISYNIGLQYAAELLPTVVRAQGVALIHIMGYVASILAPFVVYLGYITPILPLLVLGILGIIGGCLSLLLPETLGHELPQSLSDGEEFGRGQRILDFPCFNKKVDDEITDIEKQDIQYFVRSTQTGASLRAQSQAES